MNALDFDTTFQALTGNPPFPWQQALYQRFIAGDIPASCNLPTGLGKTSVIAIWLIAQTNRPDVMPRRLVYVVNRRTVVDQTTDEVEHYIEQKVPGIRDFAISTLRGQFADNREWSADPSRPAVICGTVDMIGSRLLFSGYGVGFKSKPLHAGFLGQDVLLVHDEAHLEPAFQTLLDAIEKEQRKGRTPDYRPMRVMELTATSRGGGEVFELTPEEKQGNVPVVSDRLFAKKAVKLIPAERAKVAAKIGELALRHKDNDKAVLIFVRTIEDVNSVRAVLTEKNKGVSADRVQMLTGTLRGWERDQLAASDRIFARFMPRPKVEPTKGTVYLVCTSAGEVGVDISADHMVSDLTTLDSMAQRFGRVNRRGGGAAEIDIVYESDPDSKKKDEPLEKARWATLARLRGLPSCSWIADRLEASPQEIGRLIRGMSDEQRKATFAPEPTYLDTSDILFDAWALTTIRGKLPGRPIVEPYLHGIRDWEPPETHVAWREEVAVLDEELRRSYGPADLLEDYPLKPHELLREPSYRAFKHFELTAKRHPEASAWLVDDDGTVKLLKLTELADKDEKERIEGKTVLLPPGVGGLEGGMLAGNSPSANDIADEWYEDKEQTQHRRRRVWNDDSELDNKTKGMRLIRQIEIQSDDDDMGSRSWCWFEIPRDGDSDGSKGNQKPVLWCVHVKDVVDRVKDIVSGLPLSDELKDAIVIAAEFHDHGKQRKLFQAVLGNNDSNLVLAKSGKRGGRVAELYRHEFGSLRDIQLADKFTGLSPEMQDLVLHLIAAHHGRGRPHFPKDEVFDPDSKGTEDSAIAAEVPRRFARLQRKYGRWGLAYLESLLRAADYAASAKPSAFVEDAK
ncbi:MAG TPA: type I-U CRISPR-associated helicase/endonuclease Cas3 [Gemmataceae bacterium]|jgi:CRISPR-associated endonuclease/helicase Cas3|nr:type I-U CRISPR-associated helicase/endonuclease Cas3 [Gemmataceae bacterium]